MTFDWADRYGVPSGVDPLSGQTFWPPIYYPLPIARSNKADVWDRESLTVQGQDIFELEHSHRMSMAFRARWEREGAGNYWFVSAPYGGRSFGLNERFRENFEGGDPTELRHNPTMGGARNYPNNMLAGGAADTLAWWRPSPSLHSRLFRRGLELVSEGAVIPMEFDVAGQETEALEGLQAGDHGGDEYTAVLWWRMRQFLRLTLNHAGRENIHRIEAWTYYPREWRSNRWPFDGQCSVGIHWSNVFAPQAHVLDLEAGTITDLGADWSGNDKVNVQLRRSSTIWSGDLSRQDPSLCPSGHLGVILEASAKDFAVGWYAHLHRETRGYRRPHRGLLTRSVAAGNPTPAGVMNIEHGDDAGTAADATTRYRAPGWVALQLWWATGGSLAEVRAKLETMHGERWDDDRRPKFDLPPWVTAGTEPPREGSW